MVRISGHRPRFNPRWDRVFLGVGFGRHATCLVILLYEKPGQHGCASRVSSAGSSADDNSHQAELTVPAVASLGTRRRLVRSRTIGGPPSCEAH